MYLPLAPEDQPGPAPGLDLIDNGLTDGETLQVALAVATQTRAGPTLDEMVHQEAIGSVCRICLWGDTSILTSFRVRLERAVQGENLVFNRVVASLVRIQQPDGRIRFDIFSPISRVEELLQTLRVQTRYPWYARLHIPYPERVGRGAAPVPMVQPLLANPALQIGDNLKSIRVGTLNILGVRTKRTDLRHFLRVARCHVIGLQETLLRAKDWDLRVPGYTCLHAEGDHRRKGQRGVALVISNRFTCQPVGKPSSYYVFARLMGGSLIHPILVGTVYVPSCRGRQRQYSLKGLARNINKLRQEFPTDPVILGGDFNMPLETLQREVAGWPHPLAVLSNEGHVPTSRRGTSAIDHIAYWGAVADANARIPPPRVYQDWDISDHSPVVAQFPNLVQCAPLAPPPPDSNILPRVYVKVKEERTQIFHANPWAPLAEELQELQDPPPGDPRPDPGVTLAAASSAWTRTCHEVAQELELIPPARQPVVTISHLTKRAICRRLHAYRRYRRALRSKDAPATHRFLMQYRKAQTRCRKAVRHEQQKKWRHRVRIAQAQMLHYPRGFWQFSKQQGRWSHAGAPAGLQPVKSSEGVLLTTLPDIVARWGEHYRILGTDVTGHSRDPDYWTFLEPAQEPAMLEELNRPITDVDTLIALEKMKRHRAPGQDGIPTDFIQACLNESQQPVKDDDPPPATPMTDSLTLLLNLAFESGSIPPNWEESVVLSLPKTGDLADCGNYRGISLMSTTLKVLTVILSDRINRAFEAHNLFSPTQAGFRSLEECVTQAACVIDILQRRRIAKETTYATFIDLKKAYDTVPHEGLFQKLSNYGVRGRCLDFVKGLYKSSKITVRVGHGAQAQFAPSFALERGLRQGCPLSPVLFNIFINDLMEELAGITGVPVPYGTPRDHDNRTMHFMVPGALFADDAVGLSPTIEKSIMFCNHVTNWCDLNEMSVGIRKCGIMEFAPFPTEDPFLTEDHPLRSQLKLQGQALPVVKEYTYLGLGITPRLSIEEIVAHRFKMGRSTVSRLGPFLACSTLPINMRWTVLRAVVLPRLLFGAEIYGMNRVLTNRMQVLLNKALKSLASSGRQFRVASAPLWHAYATKPICALAAGRKVRAFLKCKALKTQVCFLVENIYKTRRWTWSSGTCTWMKVHFSPHWREGAKALLGRKVTGSDGEERPFTLRDWQTLSPHEARSMVELGIASREHNIRRDPRRESSDATETYFKSGFRSAFTNLVHARIGYHPNDIRSVSWVLRARIAAFPMAPALSAGEKPIINPVYTTTCPFCAHEGEETMYHLIFECSAWRKARQRSGIQGTIDAVDALLEKRRKATSDKEVQALRKLGLSDMSDESLRLAWILGGVYGKSWGVGLYYPNPPPPDEAEDSAVQSVGSVATYDSHSSGEGDSDLSVSTLSTEDSVRTGEPPLGSENLPHLLKVGRFLAQARAQRARLLVRLSQEWKALCEAEDQSRPAQEEPGTAAGQGLNTG